VDRAAIEALASVWMGFWQRAGLAGFDEVHAEDFVDRGAADRPPDRGAFRRSVEQLYSAFPDFMATTDFVAVDEKLGLATIRWTATGRQAGPFLGRPATGRAVAFEGIEIIRCRDGQVVERWGEWRVEPAFGAPG
jgi:predicted ester cyclase